ncbi:hypothetical protein [Niveispirillum sp. KHB5.9]|uniref:hypothetical protein n=1 Tax=Niveispirillum sp. KHB5.9 TaxID=3400269 RepID=UPI003A843214
MQYLGGLRGAGTLTCGDELIAPVEYDFEGFLELSGQVVCAGQIRLAPSTLREIFGRRDLCLQTADGRRLSLRFTDKHQRPPDDVAHVDVGGDLPARSEWHH